MRSLGRILKLILFTLAFVGATQKGKISPIPIEKQLNKSYGVIDGQYQGKTYKKLSSGEIVTIASFKILRSVGFKYREILNKNNFKIILHGGVWQGIRYTVKGNPKFDRGKRVILLVVKGKEGFILNNLGLGKYNVYREDNTDYLQSAVFPEHSSLGRIKLTELEKKIVDIFGKNLAKVNHSKLVYGKKNKENNRTQQIERNPSSLEKEEQSSISVLWTMMKLAILVGILGFYPFYLLKNR